MSNAPTQPNADGALDRGLARAAVALDREVAGSGSVDRVLSRALARVKERPMQRSAWFAIAATLLVAAGLGSLADLALINARNLPGQELVVLDPLVFGPAEVELQ